MSCITCAELVNRQYRNLSDNATVGKGVPFMRVRRITGYLVGGGVARFNDGKKAELRDRVKHDRV